MTLRSSADTITQQDEGEQLGELVEMFVLQKVCEIALDSCVSCCVVKAPKKQVYFTIYNAHPCSGISVRCMSTGFKYRQMLGVHTNAV